MMEIRRLRSLVSDATGILHDAPELNMCNYTGNQVAELNYAVIQAYSTSWKGRNTSSPTRASPYPASRRPGTNPLSARESPGASGHTTCATPSPPTPWMPERTSTPWPTSWATPTSRWFSSTTSTPKKRPAAAPWNLSPASFQGQRPLPQIARPAKSLKIPLLSDAATGNRNNMVHMQGGVFG